MARSGRYLRPESHATLLAALVPSERWRWVYGFTAWSIRALLIDLTACSRVSAPSTLGKVELGVALASLASGVAALALAETAAAEALLATFVATTVVVWTVEMLHRAGVIPVVPIPPPALTADHRTQSRVRTLVASWPAEATR